MKEIIRFVKKLFGRYEPGYEYWVNTKDIEVPEKFKKSRINEKKWRHKMNYFLKTGKLESKIILDKNFVLRDGFSSMKIAHLKGIEKVPVYFID